MRPQTQYADSDGVSIAYQTAGEGPLDMLFVLGLISQVEHLWEEPSMARFIERLASFSRVIIYDRRGAGLSDSLTENFTTLDELADVLAVLDAAGSTRAAVFAYAGGGAPGALLAARHPDRVSALIMYSAIVRATAAPGYEWTHTQEERARFIEELASGWGQASGVELVAPSRAGDEVFRDWFARLQRLAASPGTIRAIFAATSDMDVREELPTISVPTLVLHRPDAKNVDVRHSLYVANAIPGARYVALPGIDSLPFIGDVETLLGEVEEFLTGARGVGERQRALLTVMFTDIVDATGHARRLGDQGWRDLLAAHDAAVREELRRFSGREVKTIGDSFMVVFDAPPSIAVRCAAAIVQAVRGLGIEIRIGLHTGECELIGEDVGGMAVHIAARVSALAGPGEVLASGTTFGTVVGAGFDWDDRGAQPLKGVAGRWPLLSLRMA
ncbi:MAG: adenylate/guanylate cyclase domain-containing protein [Solirubrobacteraceae bacterium]